MDKLEMPSALRSAMLEAAGRARNDQPDVSLRRRRADEIAENIFQSEDSRTTIFEALANWGVMEGSKEVDEESIGDNISTATCRAKPDVLAELKKRCIDKLRSLLGLGILDLPDDVLCLIAEEIIVASIRDQRATFQITRKAALLYALRFSHICRRFRAIIVGLPQAWCKISSSLPNSNIIKLFIERSKNAGLDISIELSWWRPQGVSFLMEIIPFSDRWKGLRLRGHTRSLSGVSLRKTLRLMSLPNRLHLSNLESFHIEHVEPIIRESGDENAGEAAANDNDLDEEGAVDDGTIGHTGCLYDFKALWLAPNLRSVSIANDIPLTLSSAITEFNITFGVFPQNEQRSRTWDVKPFLTFLRATSSIRILGITIRERLAMYSLQSTFLPNILVFNLEVCAVEKKYVEHLFSALVLPNINTFQLTHLPATSETHHSLYRGRAVEEHYCSINDGYLKSFFEDTSQYPNLRSVHINVRSSKKQEYFFPFQYFPHLQHLSLCHDFSANAVLDPSNADAVLPPLRSLGLRGCGGIKVEWLRDLIQTLASQGNLASFEELVVEGCRYIDENSLSFVPCSKLVFSRHKSV